MLVTRGSWRGTGAASVTGVLLVASIVLFGCSRTEGPSTSTGTPSSVNTDEPSTSPSPTIRPTGEGSEPTRLPTGGTTGPTVGASPTPTLMAGKLTLQDFFMPDDMLNEDIYNIATETKQMGVGAVLDGYDVQVLELRLENRFNKLTFKAGQDNDSESSDFVLRVEVYKNGTSDTFVDVPFNEIHQFEVDVTNVNALKIELTSRSGDGKPHSSYKKITAVVFDINLE